MTTAAAPKTRKSQTSFKHNKATLYEANCFDWLRSREANSVHGVVTDPPYGLVEYSSKEINKLNKGRGGVWRIPPSFDGCKRSPLPRFTTLTATDLEQMDLFFEEWGGLLLKTLVPGAHAMIASNPLVVHIVTNALVRSGFEPRGNIIRTVMTMRGGDRPKNAHEEFSDISVMPRSKWEPWVLVRKPLEGRVQDNLRKWKTGGLRRISDEKPFGDLIQSSPTRGIEKSIAPHPSLKPQAFMRQVVRSILPLKEGIVLDPFAGSGSTLAAAEANGYASIGVEMNPDYLELAKSAIPKLSKLDI